MPAQPQDRKPRKGEPFRFTGADGETYKLPTVAKGRKKMSGRDFRDAMLGGEAGQGALMFKILEAAGPEDEALDALYALQGDEMMDILKAWGEHGDGDGASLGE